jgi:hypothetical protein
MSVKKIIGIVLVIGFMSIFGCGGALAEVSDDDGNFIIEEEIKVNIGDRYRVGCTIGGGLLSAGVGLVVGALSYVGICGCDVCFRGDFRCHDDKIKEFGAFYSGFIPTVAIGITTSYCIGKHLDQQRAINRIAQQKGWPEKNPVLDDDGYLITEAEIVENIDSVYRKGSAIGGGVLLAVPAGVLFSKSVTIIPCTIAIGTAGIATGYYIGKYFDRRQAINHIKAQRRQQKKHALGEEENADGFYLRLLKVTF